MPSACIVFTIRNMTSRSDQDFAVHIGVFAKPPKAHKVKTRLIPDIGAERATQVYRQCLQHALDITAASGLSYCFYLTDHSDEPVFSDCEQQLQHGADLGERMLNAFKAMLEEHDAAIIIGTDCLDMTAEHLQQAARLLKETELVIQPVFDGGYSLIGCKKVDDLLFDQVCWSTETVLAQTISNAEKLDYQVSLLETVRDIDTLEDLKHYPQFGALIAD